MDESVSIRQVTGILITISGLLVANLGTRLIRSGKLTKLMQRDPSG